MTPVPESISMPSGAVANEYAIAWPSASSASTS